MLTLHNQPVVCYRFEGIMLYGVGRTRKERKKSVQRAARILSVVRRRLTRSLERFKDLGVGGSIGEEWVRASSKPLDKTYGLYELSKDISSITMGTTLQIARQAGKTRSVAYQQVLMFMFFMTARHQGELHRDYQKHHNLGGYHDSAA